MSRFIKIRPNSSAVQILKSGCLVKNTPSKRRYSLAETSRIVQQQARNTAAGVITSPLGPCKKIPSENLVEYVWKKSEAWMDKPAAVSIFTLLINNIHTNCFVCVVLKMYVISDDAS